jgi:PilZ domain
MDTIYSDRRKYRRQNRNAPGQIIRLSRGVQIGATVRCLVINISRGGALIDFESDVTAPEFYLELDTEPGKLRLCSVVRRVSDKRLSVEFVI